MHTSKSKRMRAAVVPIAFLTAVGCAGTPKPTVDLIGAHTLVSQAEQSDAQQYASADLEAARGELRQADQVVKDKPVVATRLAQQASADAELALARTRAVKAERALKEVNSATETLRTESERDRAGQAPASAPTQRQQTPQ